VCACARVELGRWKCGGRCWRVRSSVMNRTSWDKSMLDHEPCKNDERLSEMDNEDVSASELATNLLRNASLGQEATCRDVLM
jgi:hypothetical protein